MAPDGLDESEKRRIQTAARRAAARFTWYDRVLDDLPDGASAHGIPVPLLSEDDLATTYYASEGWGRRRTYVTSGTSTGIPKRVWWPEHDHRKYVEQRACLIQSFVGGACESACADLGTGHAADSALEVFARAGLRAAQIDVRLPIAAHVAWLRRDRPDLLFTMPMILERIISEGRLGYVPRRLAVVGDVAPIEWRAAIAERLGMDPIHILDVLGSIEVGAIAYSDIRAGGYVFHRHIIPEVFDDSGAPAQTGQLAVTSLARTGFPAVRYVSGDIVSGFRRFETEHGPRWGYERHLGRRGNELKHGEMLSVHAIAVALAKAAPGAAWSVRRSGLEVVIEIDRLSYSIATANAVRAEIRNSHPDVDTMIRSGLVGDIQVEPVSFTGATAKRRMPAAVP
jgi:phenylacetate-coenzyme A ligase PaaK-like adenylate-forming protein